MRKISCGTCKNNLKGVGCNLSSWSEHNGNHCLERGERQKLEGWEIGTIGFNYSMWEPKLIIELDEEDFML